MMSYFGQDENPKVNADKALLIGPMAADLIALDKLYASHGYGVSNAFDGPTIWGFGTSITPAVRPRSSHCRAPPSLSGVGR